MNRQRASVSQAVLKQVHAELNIRLMHLRRYLRAVDLEPELPKPTIDVDKGGGPQEIARDSPQGLVSSGWPDRKPHGPVRARGDDRRVV